MALSQETQAIIDRLKAEGDLVRNSGTNSIKSVKVQMDKFQTVFDAISENVAESTRVLQLQAGIAADEAERARTREQQEELVPPTTPTTTDDSPTSNSNQRINEIGDSIASALSLKNIALGAAGLFVGYNLLKGFIDEKTDGGFSAMEKSLGEVQWSELPTRFNEMTGALGEVAWTEVKDAANAMSAGINAINFTNLATAVNTMTDAVNAFSTWLGETGVDDIVAAVVAGGLVTAAARGGVQGIMGAGGNKKLAGRFASIVPNIAMAAAGVAIYYGEEIETFLQGLGMEEGDADLAQDLLAASLLFARTPQGLLIAAAASVGIFLGNKILGWVKDFQEKETEKFNQAFDQAIEAAQAEPDQTNLSDDTKEKLGFALNEARRRTQLAIGDVAVAEAERAQAEIEEVLAKQQLATDGSGASGAQMEETARALLSGNMEAFEEALAFAQAREGERGFLSRTFGGTPEEYIRDRILGLGNYIGAGADWRSMTKEQQDQIFADRQRYEQTVQQILQERGFRRGTGGFKDFGAGTVSILHGQEAVVPLNSPEGQILNNLYNGRSPADVVSNGASGMLGTTIINSPVNNVSQPITVTDGGQNVSVTNASFGGGGSGGGGGGMYGLTSGLVQ